MIGGRRMDSAILVEVSAFVYFKNKPKKQNEKMANTGLKHVY